MTTMLLTKTLVTEIGFEWSTAMNSILNEAILELTGDFLSKQFHFLSKQKLSPKEYKSVFNTFVTTAPG